MDVEEKDQVDFVNPVFLWISSIENKVEETSRVSKVNKHHQNVRLSASTGSPLERPLSSLAQPSSPFLRAKSAIKRTFSSGHDSETNKKRSAKN